MIWVSTKDRLPDTDRLVLLWDSRYNRPRVGKFNKNRWYSGNFIAKIHVSYWCEIDEPN